MFDMKTIASTLLLIAALVTTAAAQAARNAARAGLPAPRDTTAARRRDACVAGSSAGPGHTAVRRGVRRRATRGQRHRDQASENRITARPRSDERAAPMFGS